VYIADPQGTVEKSALSLMQFIPKLGNELSLNHINITPACGYKSTIQGNKL
jgi:hypothetical protein